MQLLWPHSHVPGVFESIQKLFFKLIKFILKIFKNLLPFEYSKTDIVASKDAAARNLPSGEKLTLLTVLSWTLRVFIVFHSFSDLDQILM